MVLNGWEISRSSVSSVDISRSNAANAGGAMVAFKKGGEVQVFSEISEHSLEDLAKAMGVTPAALCGAVRKVFKRKTYK